MTQLRTVKAVAINETRVNKVIDVQFVGFKGKFHTVKSIEILVPSCKLLSNWKSLPFGEFSIVTPKDNLFKFGSIVEMKDNYDNHMYRRKDKKEKIRFYRTPLLCFITNDETYIDIFNPIERKWISVYLENDVTEYLNRITNIQLCIIDEIYESIEMYDHCISYY